VFAALWALCINRFQFFVAVAALYYRLHITSLFSVDVENLENLAGTGPFIYLYPFYAVIATDSIWAFKCGYGFG
jgi:hypothetical protein